MDNRTVEFGNHDEALVRLARLAASARDIEQPEFGLNGKPYLVLASGDKVFDVEHLLPAPIRKRELATLHTVESFCAYVRRHAQEGCAVVFFDEASAKFVAVLNYHPSFEVCHLVEADWCDHRAVYALPASVDWLTWTKADGRRMSQADFATFVEDNLPDIVAPEGGALLEMVKTLQAKRSVTFESAVRLDNGATEFVYLEDIRGTTTKAKVDIPTEFQLALAPFRGELPFRVTARLRYRLNDGALQIWFDLLRPHKVVEQVLGEIRARIASETGVPVFAGVL